MICRQFQTEAGINKKCDECNFEAENERELGIMGGPVITKVKVWISVYFLLIPEVVKNVDTKQKAKSLFDLDAHTWDIHD